MRDEIRNLIDELRSFDCSVKLNENGGIKLVAKDKSALSEELIQRVRSSKSALIEYLLSTTQVTEERIEKVPVQENYPISDAQRRLWVLCQFDDVSKTYNIPGSIRIRESLDVEIFEMAVNAVIKRHEILRTIFKQDENGEVRQWVLSPDELPFKLDFRDLRSEQAKEELIQKYIAEDSFKEFSFEQGPLLRAALLQTEDDAFTFYFNMHHIISDAWSSDILIREVSELYETFKRGTVSELKELEIQYKDYSVWQLNQLKTESFQNHKKYWLNALNGELPLLDLPAFKKRPKVKTSSGHAFRMIINPSITDQLRTFTRQNSGSLFTSLLAAWNVLMYRYTGQNDIILGTPVAGREQKVLENQIGFYVNTLALRNQIAPNESFSDFSRRVNENTLEALSHQMYPFDRLIEDLDLERAVNRSAVFDVMFAFHENKDQTIDLNSYSSQVEDLGGDLSKFDVSITATEMSNSISIHVLFNPDVYEHELIKQLMRHFQQLLDQLLGNPRERLDTLNFLSDKEENELLETFNAKSNSSHYPTVVSLFEEQVNKTPAKRAVSFKEKNLSYEELNKAANQFADYLSQTHQVEKGDLVAIKLERSDWLIVSILGVLKVGGAYVPIDPNYPKNRKEFIEKDTSSRLIVDADEIEKFKQERSAYSDKNKGIEIEQDQLAYIIYTSGSTGEPKGVMIQHKNVGALIQWSKREFEKTPIDDVLFTTSINFDLSVFEIFYPLTSGKSIRLLKDGLEIPEYLNDEKRIMVNTVPSVVGALLREGVDLSSINALNMAGEPIPEDVKSQLIGKIDEIRNLYGPSEDTTYSTCMRVDLDQRDLIGKPIDDTQVYVLNDALALQPVGVIGEIFIAGAGLAKGYLNQETLTSEKFIAHPFESDAKCYRSGDMGRWLPDGNLQFIGRRDDQVKIRGYRIELNEIQIALLSHEKVANGVVTSFESNNEKELVAYYVLSEEETLTVNDLVLYLKKMLPAYMIPAHFELLEEIPLTPNGKVDVKSLPKVGEINSVNGADFCEARSDLEKSVVAIWKRILRKETIGLNNDFFLLGGHSLRALRLINEYQKSFDVKLAVNDLFVHTTVAAHVKLIETSVRAHHAEIPSMSAAELADGKQNGFPISNAQRRIWVLSQFEDTSVAYNIPGISYLNLDLNIENFQKAIQAVIDRHEILRTIFKENEDGELRQWVIDTDQFEFDIEVIDVSKEENPQERLLELAHRDADQPFDLENGPLMRATLICLGEREFAFYHNLHHIINDGWSKNVLSNDILEFYHAYQEDRSPDLKDLRIQYKEFSTWQRNQLNGESFEEDRNYWLDSLSGELPLLELPISKQRPVLKTYAGRSLTTYIGSEDTQRVLQYSQENGGSQFMALLTVWNVLMYRYTSEKELIVGSPVTGRDHSDLEDQIGFYVNVIALRNRLEPTDSFHDFFQKVKENTLNGFKHQKYPFDHLVEELEIPRDTSRNIIFDVNFSVLHDSEDVAQNTITDEIVDDGFVKEKFDMTIVFRELGDSLSFQISYNTDIYEKQSIEHLMNHFKQLLNAVLESPQEALSKVNFLSELEVNNLKRAKNNTDFAYSNDQTLLDLFSEQVTRVPDEVAIRFRQETLTYAQLDKRTDELALCLIKEYTIQPNDRIGIFMDRSEWLLISMLAALKAGATYVPIDTKATTDRQAFIVSDIQPKLLLILSESMFDILEFDVEAFSVDLQLSDWVEANPTPEQKLKAVQPSQSAYVIYTSGSTGTPKGVEVTHGNLYNYLNWAKTAYLDNGDTQHHFGLYSSPSFDLTVTSLFLPLVSGGTLYIYPPELEISELLKEYFDPNTSTNIIKMTPAHVQVLQHLDLEATNVKTAIIGGEELRSDHVRTLRELNPQMRIFNEYGPTECTVGCTVHEVENEEAITIGKPIANTQVYIVDDFGNLQPEGVIGELLIGGKAVTKGYLNKEDQTKERYIYPTFLEGARVYRTGDLAKWLPNGELDYQGRNDDQVKIRGHRVELGEIEARMMEVPFIKDACVLLEKESEESILIGCVVVNDDRKVENVEFELQTILQQQLPQYMIPNHIWEVESIPVTKNGKVDKKGLSAVVSEKSAKPEVFIEPNDEFEEKVSELWNQILKQDSISVDKGFFTVGGDSIRLIELKSKIEKTFNSELRIADLYKYTTIQQQAEMLKKEQEENGSEVENESLPLTNRLTVEQDDIAVIGMAIRAPGTKNLHEFWENLAEGKDLITHFNKEELLKEGVSEHDLDQPNYVKSNSYLNDKEYFDSAFFGYLPDEASLMDPQTRVFHEVVWSALDDAGYDPQSYLGMIGLFAGSPENVIWEIYSQLSNGGKVDEFAASHLSNSSYANSLIAHKLNLKGPVSTTTTACSTSLVTIHQAVTSLLNGECHIAVAGGTSIKNKKYHEGYWHQEGMIYSKDGRNKTFDQDGSGTIGGEGSGAVVLKRLSEAIKDGDQIYAVIKGSAINNDGDRKVGYTAPSVNGQAEVIQLAQRNAGVEPETISYVEAHGTATNLGDPVEVLGLTQAFGKSDEKYCALGSVKSNVGHLDSAAGVAGFIKTVLCLKHKQLVPSLHFEKANPEINFENSPFFVSTETKEWNVPQGPLRAGVSAFGIGGTNAHIILEEAPHQTENKGEDVYELIVLSAKSKGALIRQQEALKEFLLNKSDVHLSDVAWTLQNRAAFEYRSSYVVKTVDDLQEALASTNQINTIDGAEKKTVFLFSGQGTQYQNMGRDLYADEQSIFRQTMDSCFEIASTFSETNFREILYPLNENEENDLINQTINTQPLLFMLEYALTEQLEAFGISPDIMIGHSIGEYVAACKAGVFSLEDAIKLVIKRGELMQGLPKGSMLAVGLSEESIKQYLKSDIDVAAINTPNSCVLSGPTMAIEALAEHLERGGVMAKILHTSHAFHSSMMDPILDEFTAIVETVEMNRPKIPYVSNLTGKVVTSNQWENTKYWANQIRGAVRFSDGVNELLQNDHLGIIEVGPGDTLINMTRQQLEKDKSIELSSLIRHPKVESDDTAFLLKSLSQMWMRGLKLDWNKLAKGKNKRKISLPTYSFEKIKYPDGYTAYEFVMNGFGNLNQEFRLDEKDWYYEPYWKPFKLRTSTNKGESGNPFIVFCDSEGVGEELVQLIKATGSKVISVLKGESFMQKDEFTFEINPSHFSDYQKLFSALNDVKYNTYNIIHLLSLNKESNENIQENMELGYYSLLHIAKELQKVDKPEEVVFVTVTNKSEQVFSEDEIFPSKGMMSGINIVINQENQWARTKLIDVDSIDSPSNLSQLLWREVVHKSEDKHLAYRNGKRWSKEYSSIDLSQLNPDESAFKNDGTYVITGGLGGFGYMLSEYLISNYNANLILLGRTSSEQLGERSVRLSTLQSIGNVLYYSVNLSDFSATEEAINAGTKEFGAINGVIHAAGNVSEKSLKGINFLTPSDCKEQFLSKVEGTNVLAKLMEERELDFCLFMSSLASVIGGKEFGAYASANSYLDSFAHSNRIKNCVSINFDGLAVNGPSSDGTSLAPDEILRVVEKVLLSPEDRQLAVSLTDLTNRIERWVYPEIVVDEFIPSEEDDFEGFDRPNLSNEYVAPVTETEKEVCQLLESFFGLKAIGIDDDFFELGGDSLKAMTMISRIHQKFDIQLQIREVMQNANVRSLSKEIDLRLKMREMELKRSKTNFENKIEL